MRISDWSSDVCSSDLARLLQPAPGRSERGLSETLQDWIDTEYRYAARAMLRSVSRVDLVKSRPGFAQNIRPRAGSIIASPVLASYDRSEEHTSELQSLMSRSCAVFCLHKNTNKHYNEIR